MCIVSTVANRKLTLSPQFYDDDCYQTTIGSTIYYQPTTEEEGYINVLNADVFYPLSVVTRVYTAYRLDDTVEWICDVIKEKCPETWEWNNFDKNDNKCHANYKALPLVEGETSAIDGKSLGCKILHAVFASENPNHCAHTSFVKQEDPNGNIKCQKSGGVLPEEIFTPEMLGFFNYVGMNLFGYDELLFKDTCA